MTSVSSNVLPMDDLLSDFESKQRGLLLMAIDKAVDKAIKKQSDMLGAIQTQVQQRHQNALDKLSHAQPSLVHQLTLKTLDSTQNCGLVSWINDQTRKSQALDSLLKLRSHLEAGQGKAFRNDFEGLLALYMEQLEIPNTKLTNRIEDFYEALLEKADSNDDLVNLVHRVRWACVGVRSISNAHLNDTTLLSESEILELCGCFSAIGAGMPTLALLFQDSPDSTASDVHLPSNGSTKVDLNVLKQLRQAAGNNSSDQTPFDYIIQLMTTNGFDVNLSPPAFQAANGSSFPPGFSNDTFSLSDQSPPLPPGLNGSTNLNLSTSSALNLNGSNGLVFDTSSGLNLNGSRGLNLNGSSLSSSSSLNLSSLNLNGFSGLNGSSTQAPSLSRLGSIGSTSSNSSQQPPFPPGYNDNSGGVWSQPPLPPSIGSPHEILSQPPLPPGYESPQQRSPHHLRSESPMQSLLLQSPPLRAESPSKRLMQQQPSTGFAVKQNNDVPTQAMLALVPTFKLYHNRPTELPKEMDRVRKAMFARMLNHMDELPKATLCPLQQDHDPTCPLSHTYIEVMTYNPLYKRLICRQPSHYWGSQIEEDDSCVCLHVDTGVTWEWMDEARDKRMYCARGAKCSNSKCIKSHSFEEMCWYNPSYKIKRCTVRTHDHIARARGTIAPPLDCAYYHIEEGKNTDKREFTAEYDHVGKDIKMLFIERSHKPLADRLEALRFTRASDM